jgi:hypothetical protein
MKPKLYHKLVWHPLLLLAPFSYLFYLHPRRLPLEVALQILASNHHQP